MMVGENTLAQRGLTMLESHSAMDIALQNQLIQNCLQMEKDGCNEFKKRLG